MKEKQKPGIAAWRWLMDRHWLGRNHASIGHYFPRRKCDHCGLSCHKRGGKRVGCRHSWRSAEINCALCEASLGKKWARRDAEDTLRAMADEFADQVDREIMGTA